MRQLVLGFLLFVTYCMPSWAADTHHIEVIIFRQAGVKPVINSRAAPDNWQADAKQLEPEQFRSSLLDNVVSKLTDNNGYQILLHRAWQQTNSPSFKSVALSSGEDVFGHHPIEGTFTIRQDRANEIELNFWVNQFQADGSLSSSEHFKQTAVIPYKELSYIDYGSLGALIRVLPQ